MPPKITPICDFGAPIIDFTLKGVDNKMYSLLDLQGVNGTLIAFICNHCPYVIAIRHRLMRDVRELATLGVNTIAISSNDVKNYPQDSFENMRLDSAKYKYPFMYLYDETQAVAKSYEAVCTPDFFGYNANGRLQYRGRLDESRKEVAGQDVRRDLFIAMSEVAKTGKGPQHQFASMGCSIKWKIE